MSTKTKKVRIPKVERPKTKPVDGESPFSTYVKQAYRQESGYRGELFTTQEIADTLGRHKNTIKRWRGGEGPQPSIEVKLGKKVVNLYTAGDLKKLTKYSEEE